MITDVRVASAPDLSVDNEVMKLNSVSLPEGETLAGMSWLVANCSAYDALLSLLRRIYGLIGKKCPDHKVWLFVGNSAWQPDTRIVRYRKLWAGLAARGITVSHSSGALEVMHESKGKLKFFGATQLSELSVESVVKVLLDEYCSYLVILPKLVRPDAIINIGWSGNLTEDSKLIESIIMSDGLLIKRFGEFDDEEKGIVAIGHKALVNFFAIPST